MQVPRREEFGKDEPWEGGFQLGRRNLGRRSLGGRDLGGAGVPGKEWSVKEERVHGELGNLGRKVWGSL